MIPYEDLVTALSNWRIQQGLPVGDADYLGEPRPLEFNLPVAEPTAADSDFHTGEADILDESIDASMEEGYAGTDDYATAADEEASADFENLGTGDYDEGAVQQASDVPIGEDIDIHEEPTAYGSDAGDYAAEEAPEFDEDDTAFAALDNLGAEPGVEGDLEPGVNETQELSIEDADVATGDDSFEVLEDEATEMSTVDTEDDPDK